MEQVHFVKAADYCKKTDYKSMAGQIVKLHGAVTKIRKMRGFAFVLLRTVDGVEQCLWDEESNFLLETLCEEACIAADALVVAEPRAKGGYEMHLIKVTVLSKPAAEIGRAHV